LRDPRSHLLPASPVLICLRKKTAKAKIKASSSVDVLMVVEHFRAQ